MRKAGFLSILLLASIVAHAQTYKQHPLFIYSFTRYIQWPDAYNEGDFEILVLGDSPIVEELKAMAQAKKIGDRTIKVTKINTTAEVRKCNMLFLPVDQSGKHQDYFKKLVFSLSLSLLNNPALVPWVVVLTLSRKMVNWPLN